MQTGVVWQGIADQFKDQVAELEHHRNCLKKQFWLAVIRACQQRQEVRVSIIEGDSRRMKLAMRWDVGKLDIWFDRIGSIPIHLQGGPVGVPGWSPFW